MSSVDRKLDQKLILIVKQKWPNNRKSYWLFPQIQREEDESMREVTCSLLSNVSITGGYNW